MHRHYLGLALLALVLLAVPAFTPSGYVLSIFIFGGINTILVTGLNLLMGYAGQISLGHAAFYGLGAYTSGILTARYGVPPPAAFVFAILFTALVALAIAVPTLRLSGHYLAMATLGFGIIVHIFFVQIDWLTGGPNGLTGVPAFAAGPWVVDTELESYALVWVLALVVLVLAMNLIDSRIGRGLRALASSEVAARAVGVETARQKIQVFVLSAAFASVAGSLYVHYLSFCSPETFDFLTSVVLLVMVTVGGVGTLWGSLLGALGLTILPEYLRAYHDLEVLIYGLVLIATTMFLPRGVAGTVAHLLRRYA